MGGSFPADMGRRRAVALFFDITGDVSELVRVARGLSTLFLTVFCQILIQ